MSPAVLLQRFVPIQTFSFAFDECGFYPLTPPHLYMPSQNGMKDFQKYIQENIFIATNYLGKKNTSKALFQKKVGFFFFFPSGKVEQQSRCTREKQICWLCTMEWKVHFVLLPFQAAYRLQCGMEKKKY